MREFLFCFVAVFCFILVRSCQSATLHECPKINLVRFQRTKLPVLASRAMSMDTQAKITHKLAI